MARVPGQVLCFVGICIINLMVAIDSTTLAVSLPTISKELNADVSAAYWTGTCFALCSAIFQPIFASISSIGRKAVVLLVMGLFALGSVICAVAHNVSTLLGGRCIQGMGAGGIIVLTYVLLSDLYTLEQRSKMISIIGLMWMCGTCLGPIIGGGFTENVSWRWIFWLNLPFCGVSAVLVALFVQGTKAEGTLLDRLAMIDWLGILLFASGLTSFLIGISWGGINFSWSSWQTFVPIILGCLLLILFVAVSYFVTKHPLIPGIVIRDRTAAITYFGTLLMGMIHFALLYYLPLYYLVAKGFSSLRAGAALVPICGISGFSTTVTGIAISKTGQTKIFVILGWFVLMIGLGQMNVLDTNTSTFGWLIINLPMSIGLGALFTGLALATQASAEVRSSNLSIPDAHKIKVKAMAAGLNPFFRALGQSLGIAIGQAIFSNSIEKKLKLGDSGNIISILEDSKSHSDPAIVQATVSSLRNIWWAAAGLSLLALLLAGFTHEHGLGGGSLKEPDTLSLEKEISAEEKMGSKEQV